MLTFEDSVSLENCRQIISKIIIISPSLWATHFFSNKKDQNCVKSTVKNMFSTLIFCKLGLTMLKRTCVALDNGVSVKMLENIN